MGSFRWFIPWELVTVLISNFFTKWEHANLNWRAVGIVSLIKLAFIWMVFRVFLWLLLVYMQIFKASESCFIKTQFSTAILFKYRHNWDAKGSLLTPFLVRFYSVILSCVFLRVDYYIDRCQMLFNYLTHGVSDISILHPGTFPLNNLLFSPFFLFPWDFRQVFEFLLTKELFLILF